MSGKTIISLKFRVMGRAPLSRLDILAEQAEREAGTGSDGDCDRRIADDRQDYRHEKQRPIAPGQLHALEPPTWLALRTGGLLSKRLHIPDKDRLL
jgi:hypothetical protein